MIYYFHKKPRLFIQALFDNGGCDLDLWKEVIETTVNAEAKTSLQLSSGTRKINCRYSKIYKPLAKKDKDKATWEYWDEEKAKPHNLSLTNISQPQT